MNEKNTNSGGWPASDMRAWLQDSILPMFPDTVRSNIKEVKKYSYSYSDKGTISSSDMIWIPSCREIFGESDSDEDAGPVYLTARIKRRADTPSWWWLRSASYNYDDTFYNVHYWGYDCHHDYATNDHGVAVGFCL
jgi:hypothetical protein